MVLYTLYVRAELEGVASLSLIPDANVCVSVRNPLDHAQTREKVVVDPTELEIPAKGDHDKHREHKEGYHVAIKWDNHDDHRATMRIYPTPAQSDDAGDADAALSNKKEKGSIKGHAKDLEHAVASLRPITPDDHGQFVPMLLLDCDGLEPYAFHPLGDEFRVVASNDNSKTYDKVDLASGDWSDYDLATGSISVTRFKAKIE